MRVLGISGSLRRESHNARLLGVAAKLVPPPAELELFEGLKDVPPYDEDDDGDLAPAGARRLREAIAAADAVLIATPEYNSSIPGQLKNALDWASRPFPDNVLRNKPVAVIGASTGSFGAVWAQAEVRKVLGSIGARVVDVELPVAGAEEAFGGNRLADEELQRRLARILAELVEAAGDRPAIAA
jgi:chromate reductase